MLWQLFLMALWKSLDTISLHYLIHLTVNIGKKKIVIPDEVSARRLSNEVIDDNYSGFAYVIDGRLVNYMYRYHKEYWIPIKNGKTKVYANINGVDLVPGDRVYVYTLRRDPNDVWLINADEDDKLFDYSVSKWKQLVYAISPRWFTRCIYGGAMKRFAANNPNLQQDRMIMYLILILSMLAILKLQA
jgi:hypothetical protein